METVAIPTNSNGEVFDKKDPYPYGWRDVRFQNPNGVEKCLRIPLTLEDILHPQVGDFRMHSEEHERFCAYLYNVFTARLASNAGAVVLHDVRVAWEHPDLAPHGPDIAVIFNVRRRRNWSTFDVASEGTKPSLIVEVTSPSTRSTDLEDKVEEYAQAGVPLYVIVDIAERIGVVMRRLIGYQLTQAGYVPLAKNERGWLWLEPVGVWLGLRGKNLICYDEAGNLIEDYTRVTQARDDEARGRVEAEEHADDEARRRAEAEERADDEARGRAEAEKRADDEARKRADEARGRAEAEARIRELEAALRRLRGEGDELDK